MIWLVGNKGMLGQDVDLLLKQGGFDYISSDMDVDITDVKRIDSFLSGKNIDWIINCAAYTAVDKAEDEKEIAMRINGDAVLNLAKTAASKNACLIHVSTDYVFSGTKEGTYTEEDATGPVTSYGISKLAGEDFIVKNCKKYYILRTAWLYGRNGNNFVYTMLKLFKSREQLKVVNDQFGSPTYSIDLARMIAHIIKNNYTENYGIYHYANEGKTTWHEFASEIYRQAIRRKILDKKVEILPVPSSEYPTKATRPKNSYLSKEKIKSNFSVDIRDWENALEDFLSNMDNSRF